MNVLKHTKLAVFLCFFLAFTSCNKAEKENQSSRPETGEASETEAKPLEESVEAVQILNANLATEKELVKAGIPMELVNTIIQNRPFLTTIDFHNIVSDNQEEDVISDLYQAAFVPFNLNTAKEDDFKIIPGVGDKMAHEFEEYRPYSSIKQFRREIGKYVDDDEVSRLEQYIFVPIELNSATEEDILALPGVGNKMAHEFEEYRPYSNMEQFRREIGKYVDENELARLERLVYLKDAS